MNEQPQGPFCQSCAMPMDKATDEQWGTDADGSRSNEYCAVCYNNGSFISPDMTMEQMIEISAKGWSDSDPSVSFDQALEECKKILPMMKRWQQ